MGAVGNYLTVDNEQQYRPQESPALYYGLCGRCRRYFTVLIKYIFPYCDSLPTTANCDDIDPYACTPQACRMVRNSASERCRTTLPRLRCF